MISSTKTVLFYSFKGGVGRTQLMLNSAKHLSSKGKKVLMVDLDIHAPGLSYWDIDSRIKDSEEDYLLYYIVNFFSGLDISNKVYVKEINQNLFLAPIYDMSNISTYQQLLVSFSQFSYDIRTKLNENIRENEKLSDIIFKSFINKLQDTGEYDYIFLDSRTGFTEISDILFSSQIDLKVIVSAYNKQNIKGTNTVLSLLSKIVCSHSILRILSLKPEKCEGKIIEQLKSEANLDDNQDLKNKFFWNDIMEIFYDSTIVTNDFNTWENLNDSTQYKKQVIDIVNQIEKICIGEKFEL